MLKIKFIIVLFMFISSTLVSADSVIYDRFKIKKVNQEYMLTTITEASDGLGNLLRQLKLKPNWSNRSWIKGIYNSNMSTVNKKGDIVIYGSELNIPLNSLADCQGYAALKQKVQSSYLSKTQLAQTKVNSRKILVPAKPLDSMTKAAKSDLSYKSAGNDLSYKAGGSDLSYRTDPNYFPKTADKTTEECDTDFSLSAWAGLGFSRAFNDDIPSATETALHTELAYQFAVQLGYEFNPRFTAQVYVRADQNSYEDPNNLSVQQDNDLFLTYGLELINTKDRYHLGVFTELSQSPRSQLISATTINVSDESVLKIGAHFSFAIIENLTLTFKPYFNNTFKVAGIEYENGLGAYIDLKYSFASSKFFVATSFNYEKQDYTDVENNLIQSYLKLGFDLF